MNIAYQKYLLRVVTSVSLLLVLFSPFFTVKAEFIEKLKNDPITDHFEVGPTRVALEGNQGDALEQEVTVANHLGEKMGFVVEFQDFTVSNDPDIGVEFKDEVTEEISAKNWFEPEVREFVLEQGEKMHLNIKIKIPDDAILGEHQTGVFVRNKRMEEHKEVGATVRISTRLGIPFLINVNGTKEGKRVSINQLAEFKDFVSGKKFYEKGPIDFKLIVENKGNVHVDPFGYIIIKRFGKEVDKININDWRVYRASTKTQDVKWDKGLLIGKYEAEAVLFMDVQGKREEFKKTTEFTVIPLKLIAYSIIALILFFLLWRLSLKRYARKIEKNIMKSLNEQNIDGK